VGLGDDLLAAGQAKLLNKPVRIGDGEKQVTNPLYKYIPYLSDFGEWFIDYGGHRGYYKKIERHKTWERIHFNMDYRAEPAIIELESIENDYIIIEPHIKRGAPPGKQWNHYDEVVRGCDYNFMQFNSDFLDCLSVGTSVVEAVRWIAGCKAYIGTEGFLHHLAAAFGKPAVVLFGAYSHPLVTGYDFHTNLWRDVPEELGHNKAVGAMDTIYPDEVIEALNDCC